MYRLHVDAFSHPLDHFYYYPQWCKEGTKPGSIAIQTHSYPESALSISLQASGNKGTIMRDVKSWHAAKESIPSAPQCLFADWALFIFVTEALIVPLALASILERIAADVDRLSLVLVFVLNLSIFGIDTKELQEHCKS